MAVCTVCTGVLQEQHLSRDLELLLERMESPAWDLAPQQDTYKAQHLPANKGHTAHHHQVKLFPSLHKFAIHLVTAVLRPQSSKCIQEAKMPNLPPRIMHVHVS